MDWTQIDDEGLRRLARGLLRDPHAADDAVQDALVGAFVQGRRTDGGASGRAGPRLAGFVRNAARQLARGERRRARRERAAARPEAVPSTDAIVERAEEQRRVLEAVLGLAPLYLEAILLRYSEDLPPRSIARRLDIPVDTVRTRIERARAMLARRLDDAHSGDGASWKRALVPLAVPGLAGSRLSAASGGLWMAAKAKTMTAAACGFAALLLLGFLAWRAGLPDPGDGEPVAKGAPSERAARTAPVERRPDSGPPARDETAGVSASAPSREQDPPLEFEPRGGGRKATFVVRDRDTDAPLAGVRAVAIARSIGEVPRTDARSDEAGFVILEDPGAPDDGWDRNVVFSHEGYRPKRVSWVPPTGRNDRPPAPVRLERGPALRVVVRDPAGVAVEGARVVAWSGHGRGETDERYVAFPSSVRASSLGSSRTDARGEAALGVPRADEPVFVYAELDAFPEVVEAEAGPVATRPAAARLAATRLAGHAWSSWPPAPDRRIEVVLAPELRVSGVVVHPDGMPVDGARVEHDGSRRVHGEVPEHTSIPSFPVELERRYSTRTDGEGRFALPGVPAPRSGRTRVIVRGPTWIAANVEVAVPPSGIVEDLELVFTTPPEVRRILVRDASGRPIEGARVEVAQLRPYDVTDSRGLATVFRYAGSEERPIRVEAPGYATHRAILDVLDDPHVVTLGPEHVLEGRIVGRDGGPLPAILNLFEGILDEDEFPHGMPAQVRWLGQRRTGADSTFRFEGLPPEPYTLQLRVSHAGGVASRNEVVLDASEPVVIRFDVEADGGGRRVTGSLVDTNGAVVAPDYVYLQSIARPDAHFAAAAIGATFVFDGVEPGEYRIVASLAGRVVAHRRITVPEGEDVEGLRLEIEPAVDWSGRLLVADAGARASGLDFGGLRLRARHVEHREDTTADLTPSGAFSFEGLLPGAYDLTLTLPTGTGAGTGTGDGRGAAVRLEMSRVELPSVVQASIDLPVTMAGDLVLILDDERFASVDEYRALPRIATPEKTRSTTCGVRVESPDGTSFTNGILFRGRNRCPHPLPPGPFTITVRQRELGEVLCDVRVQAGETTEVVVRFPD